MKTALILCLLLVLAVLTVAQERCCKYCTPDVSKACGDACIAWTYTCGKPPGCACNGTAPPPPPAQPDYDHQTTTYTSQFLPLTIPEAQLNVTPYFSPDHATDMIVWFIDNATTTLDIMAPDFSSWSGCTADVDNCIGCTISRQNGERFPVFPAILNALHRGVTVRLLTNSFNEATCTDMISPLDFLFLNGLNIRYFTTVTFMHAKFMKRDGKVASISSINWTRNSITNNREAGTVLEGPSMSEIMPWLDQVFEFDWSQGIPYTVNQTYSPEDMAVILDPAHREPIIPPGPTNRPIITPLPYPIEMNGGAVTVWTSPDYAFDALVANINTTKTHFEIYIYQITDSRLCDMIENMHKSGIHVRILVSKRIYGAGGQTYATKCYTQLYDAGLTIKMAWYYTLFMYNHQKYWIADHTTVTLSTGNWSPTDYPGAPEVFPPYSAGAAWRKTNRDFTISYTDPNVVDLFQKVLDADYNNATTFYPEVEVPVLG